MERVQYYSLTDQVYDSIKSGILQGKIRAQEKLDINKLAHVLGVSRMPVVDALTRLETEGLIERRNRVGTFVRPISQRAFIELFVAREMIEDWATPYIIERASESDLAALQTLLNEAKQQLLQADPNHFDFPRFNESYDMGFHLGLVRLADNRYITESYVQLNSRIRIGRSFVPMPATRSAMAQTSHEQILHAFQQRDRQAALEEQHSHRQRSLESTIAVMTECGIE
ncbi:MAG: GntR family transcriptional regulator [Caldilineaceae bacterium]